MPHKNLQLQQEQITKTLRRNALISAFCSVTGFCLLIPSFSIEGTKFDYQEFCFKPPSIPSHVTWCTGKKLKKGIAWRVALEASTNKEFQTKVKFLKYLPAQNPNAGVYGLCSSVFFLSAFFFFKQGTDDLESNLDLIVANKKEVVFEHDLDHEKHLHIQALKAQQEEEFVKDIMSREHSSAMYELMSDAEKELAAQGCHKSKQLDDAGFELQLSTMNAQKAEQEEKEAKHRVEVKKLSKDSSVKSKTSNEVDANEAAKEELTAKLKSHENGWLHTLVITNKPVFIIGSQGSWKSYCSATIALCRHYLKEQKVASLVDPHFNKNANESWKELIALEPETYGGAQDWEDVNLGIQEGFNRWNYRTLQDESLTSIWDEQTNWILHDECAISAKEFMGRVISDPRKSNEGVLVITHSFTNAGTGGSSGFAASREEGILQLRLNADNEMKPLFKGKLIGFKDEDGELIEDMKISIPKDWFNPTSIRKMFAV